MKPSRDYYDLTTYDGRLRLSNAIKDSNLAGEAQRTLLKLLSDARFPARIGRPPKPAHDQVRDFVKAIGKRAQAGISAADAGERDRAYRPNRKRPKAGGKKK